MIRGEPEDDRLGQTAADMRANAQRGVLSALFGVEGGHALLPGDEASCSRTCARSTSAAPAT